MNSLDSAITKARNWITLVRSDPESASFWRFVGLGLLSCLIISYAGYSLFVEPQQKILDKKNVEIKEIKLANPDLADDTLVAAIPKLDLRIKNLEEQIEISRLQEKVLLLQRQTLSDPEQFNKIILTLNPAAPVKIGAKLKQMDNLASRAQENFQLHLMLIKGEADFSDLLNYIKYLEQSQEIAFMDDLSLESRPAAGNKNSGKVSFSLQVGRLDLNGQPGG